jgi:tRNA nucleotidyltransferase (CCA-adding enzyme)
VGEFLPIAVVLSLAAGQPLSQIGYSIDRYLNPHDPVAHPVTLVNGKELMAALNLSPSPLVGQLLHDIQIARIRGEVGTKQEAVNYALINLKRLSSRNI